MKYKTILTEDDEAYQAVTLSTPPIFIDIIDKWIKEGRVPNRSEGFRIPINEFLRERGDID